MTKLVCITNPSIVVTAPDEFVTEVGGNCWQVGGPQPLTYPKQLWRREEQPSLPSNLDEAAEKNFETMEVLEHENIFEETHNRIFKAGAEWMAGQGVTKETQVYANRWTDVDEVIVNLGQGEYGFKAGDKVIVQIRKKEV